MGCMHHPQLTIPMAFSSPSPTPHPLKKEEPSAAPVPNVAYEELDFQGREKTPEPPTPCVHTEYATIVFTEGLGASAIGRRGSADGPQGPRPPRHEDGHCSWPL